MNVFPEIITKICTGLDYSIFIFQSDIKTQMSYIYYMDFASFWNFSGKNISTESTNIGNQYLKTQTSNIPYLECTLFLMPCECLSNM